jgi:hypothetical protein
VNRVAMLHVWPSKLRGAEEETNEDANKH